MTDAQMKAICNALAYLISETTAVPKTTDKKQKRKDVLGALSNAARARVSADPPPITPGTPAAAASTSQPTDANQPAVLRMEMVLPDGATQEVRPGTVFGQPKRGNDGWAVSEESEGETK